MHVCANTHAKKWRRTPCWWNLCMYIVAATGKQTAGWDSRQHSWWTGQLSPVTLGSLRTSLIGSCPKSKRCKKLIRNGMGRAIKQCKEGGSCVRSALSLEEACFHNWVHLPIIFSTFRCPDVLHWQKVKDMAKEDTLLYLLCCRSPAHIQMEAGEGVQLGASGISYGDGRSPAGRRLWWSCSGIGSTVTRATPHLYQIVMKAGDIYSGL